MTLDALSSNELPSFLVYDTINASAPAIHHHHHLPSPPPAAAGPCFFFSSEASQLGFGSHRPPTMPLEAAGGAPLSLAATAVGTESNAGGGQGRRKRRRRVRTCKNKEDAESQRMTHIAVERNRRRQMNEYLAVLRSLMPESYVQRGDQASIVGGAIDFVKQLEQLLQSLEAQKRTLLQQPGPGKCHEAMAGILECSSNSSGSGITDDAVDRSPPFAHFFSYPQYSWCHSPRDSGEHRHAPSVADIEVNLVETHANLRILTPRRHGQLIKIVAGLQSMRLSILHLNVTTLDCTVLYSLSLKVEEGCSLTTVDDIAAAVHHLLSLIEAGVASKMIH